MSPSGASAKFKWRPWLGIEYASEHPQQAPCCCGDTRGLTRYLSTPRETDRSPPWRPVITGQGWMQQQEPRNKGFCETRNRTRSQKQQELLSPESPSVRNFPKHLCPAETTAGLTHTWDDRTQIQRPHWKDHSRSWVFKIVGPFRLICVITSRHRPNNHFENTLATRQMRPCTLKWPQVSGEGWGQISMWMTRSRAPSIHTSAIWSPWLNRGCVAEGALKSNADEISYSDGNPVNDQ